MMKLLATIAAGLVVAACGGNVRTADPARYDLGELGVGSPPALALGVLEVQPASWLAGPAMHFRLAYADPQRRQSYAESRWAAPPAELLEAALKRRLVFAQAGTGGAGCRLQLVLDEFEQRFDEAQKSRMVLEVQATLGAPRGNEVLLRRAVSTSRPAPGADARAGAVAARDAAQALGDELGAWLADAARRQPAIVERCRER